MDYETDRMQDCIFTTLYENSTTPPKRTVSKDHFLSSTPAVHIPDPAVVNAKGIDRPPTPIPTMNPTPPKQSSYANYSNHKLEAAYRLSPKLPPPNPFDPIFSSPSESIEEVIENRHADDELLPSTTALRGDGFDHFLVPPGTTLEDLLTTMLPKHANNSQASGQPEAPDIHAPNSGRDFHTQIEDRVGNMFLRIGDLFNELPLPEQYKVVDLIIDFYASLIEQISTIAPGANLETLTMLARNQNILCAGVAENILQMRNCLHRMMENGDLGAPNPARAAEIEAELDYSLDCAARARIVGVETIENASQLKGLLQHIDSMLAVTYPNGYDPTTAGHPSFNGRPASYQVASALLLSREGWARTGQGPILPNGTARLIFHHNPPPGLHPPQPSLAPGTYGGRHAANYGAAIAPGVALGGMHDSWYGLPGLYQYRGGYSASGASAAPQGFPGPRVAIGYNSPAGAGRGAAPCRLDHSQFASPYPTTYGIVCLSEGTYAYPQHPTGYGITMNTSSIASEVDHAEVGCAQGASAGRGSPIAPNCPGASGSYDSPYSPHPASHRPIAVPSLRRNCGRGIGDAATSSSSAVPNANGESFPPSQPSLLFRAYPRPRTRLTVLASRAAKSW